MSPRDLAILHALRRNGIGARVLVALRAQPGLTLAELRAATGASAQRIRIAIEGHYPDCRIAHSLRRLGFVYERRWGDRIEYSLTPRGRRWAARVSVGLHAEERVVRMYRHRRRVA